MHAVVNFIVCQVMIDNYGTCTGSVLYLFSGYWNSTLSVTHFSSN